jgi:CelD/BcsL family acetyltransferase involved in cellulose biosynthesis
MRSRQLSRYTVKEINWKEFHRIRQTPGLDLNWNCLFVLPSWLQPVCTHLKAEGQPAILAVYDCSRLIGLAPLTLQGRTARFLGNADVCDYQDIVAVNGCGQAVADALFEHLGAQGIRHVILKTLRPDAVVLQAVKGLALQRRLSMTLHAQDVTYEMPLPSDWEQFLSRLSGKQRHEVRRKIRRLEAYGSVELSAAGTDVDLREATDTFIDLFGRNRRDKSEFMTGPMEAYFRDLIQAMADCGTVRLYVLKVNREAAAAVLCFDYNGVRYLYNNGYDEKFQDLSIGILSKVLSIKKAIEAGCRAYDFLKGAETYKKHIGGEQVPLYCCEILLQG